jgi:Protein of unknown function (DUF3828)
MAFALSTARRLVMQAEATAYSRRTALALLLFTAAGGAARAADRTPADVVAAIYRAAAGPGGKYDDGISVFFDAAARRRFLSKKLQADFAAMMKRTPKGDEPDLDFDPVCACNDPSVDDLKIETESTNGTQAAVVASFQAHDEKERIVLRYLMVEEDGAWKVDNILSTGKDKWDIGKIITGQCPNC